MITVNESAQGLKNKAEFEQKLKELESENLDFVKERLVKQHLWLPEATEQARLDFLRFAALTMESGEVMVPTIPVDEFWHSFIIFTKDYTGWCERHWGKGFYLHHTPGHHEDGSWEKTQKMMVSVFGSTWEDSLRAKSCSTPPPQDPPSCWTHVRA